MGYEGDSLGDFVGHSRSALRPQVRAIMEATSERWREVTRENTPIETFLKAVSTKPPYHLRYSWEIRNLRILPLGGGARVFEQGIFTEVEYACVFGADTSVVTDAGVRRIADVAPGMRVLTQAGDFSRVTARLERPAVEHRDMVSLEVPWRRGRPHRLTVTQDHRLLVSRGGVNKWVAAGDLHADDLLYVRRKRAHNQGAGVVRECEQCGTRHRGQGRRYCSVACRSAAWAAGANPHLGAKRSAETRALLAQRGRERGAGRAMNRVLASRGQVTERERAVAAWLDSRGVEYEMQVPVGEHVVDFYLPASGEVIEADGAYWHQDQRADVARDRALLEAAPGIEITHMHFADPRFTPPIDPEPLAGVRYVVCNPGPASFADPLSFAAVPILARAEWRYGDKAPRSRGSWNAKVYDLSVEGPHSFVAAGVVVHNCYVEEGTGLWGPNRAPYVIRPKKPGGWLSWIARDTYVRRDGTIVKPGDRVFAKEVLHPGSPGHHMVAIGEAVTRAEMEVIAHPFLARWVKLSEGGPR